MASHRILTVQELNFINSQQQKAKTQLFWLFLIFSVVVGVLAIGIYTSDTSSYIFMNIIFGILILCIGVLYWVFKGYQKHVLNPIVYKGSGYYKRIYEQRGKYGTYYDTINGVKIKLPWHWRHHIKKQKKPITYEYIIRDGAVALNEHPIYIVSVNDVLSLDYELKHGLERTKPLSLLNIIALFLLFPALLIMCFDYNFDDALHISDALKHPSKDSIVLENAELLSTLNTSNYIKIDSAWVYQFKKTSDYLSENYIISKAERDRIYNHPSATIKYRFFVPSTYITKPDKAQLKEALKNNPLSKNTLLHSLDSSIVNKTLNKVYNGQIETYNKRVKRAKKIETLLDELKPKTYIIKIYKGVFNAPKAPLYSIKKSLEKPYTIGGFYDAKQNTLVSITQHTQRKKDIVRAFILISICGIIVLIALFSLIKIIKNSSIKLRLTKTQIDSNGLKQLP